MLYGLAFLTVKFCFIWNNYLAYNMSATLTELGLAVFLSLATCESVHCKPSKPLTRQEGLTFCFLTNWAGKLPGFKKVYTQVITLTTLATLIILTAYYTYHTYYTYYTYYTF